MTAGDRFAVYLSFLFDAQAYGDEDATGGVNIRDAYGTEGYVQVAPLEVYLEECGG